MGQIWLLMAASAIGGLLNGGLFIWGFRYLQARSHIALLLRIGLPVIVGVWFFLLPLVVLPKPVAEKPLLLFDFYLAGFFLPVLVALGRVVLNRMRAKRDNSRV